MTTAQDAAEETGVRSLPSILRRTRLREKREIEVSGGARVRGQSGIRK